MRPDFVHHRLLDVRIVRVGARQQTAAEVRGHDDDRVAEVDGAALAVRQPAVVEHLEERVEDVGVRLLDLVEENDRVGPPPHRFRELARPPRTRRSPAARRSSRATACFSMYSDMSMRTIAASSSKRSHARLRASSVFPTPVGPRNRNEPPGRFSSASPARWRRTASATARDGLVLPDDALAQTILDREELLLLAFEQLRDRNPGPRPDDFGDLLLADLLAQERLALLDLPQLRLRRLDRPLEIAGSAVSDLREPAPPLLVELPELPLEALVLLAQHLQLLLALRRSGRRPPSRSATAPAPPSPARRGP